MNSQIATIPSATSNATVQAANGALSVGRVSDLGWRDVSDHWWPAPVNTYHYSYGTTYVRPNPTEAAFKIVAKLMEGGLVEELTVKQFVKLVDDVATIVREV